MFKCKSGLCQTHCRQVPVFSRLSKYHVSCLQFPPAGQYGLCFGYLVSGPLPLRSHKRQVTFTGPFLGVPIVFRLRSKLARSILALKLSVTTTGLPTQKAYTHSGTRFSQIFGYMLMHIHKSCVQPRQYFCFTVSMSNWQKNLWGGSTWKAWVHVWFQSPRREGGKYMELYCSKKRNEWWKFKDQNLLSSEIFRDWARVP